MGIKLQATPSPQSAIASLDVIDRKKGSGLYSVVGSSVIRIDLKSPTHQKNEIAQKTDQLKDKIRAFIKTLDANASAIKTDIRPDPNAPRRKTTLMISYRDSEGKLKVLADSHGIIPQELIEESVSLLNLVQPRRNPHTVAPLELPIPKEEVLPMTLPAFANKGLYALGHPKAMEHLRATDAFIERLKEKLADRIKDPAVQKENLSQLKKLQEDLEKIDRNAVFRAIAACEKLNIGPLNDEKREKLRSAATVATLGAERDLTQKMEEWKNEHWIRHKFSFLPLIPKLPELEPSDIHGYALDVGHLLIGEDWDYQRRCAEMASKDKKSSIEHFVVQRMLHLDEKADQIHPILQGLDEASFNELFPLLEASQEAAKSHLTS